MGYKVEFNNHNLHEFLKIESISSSITPTRSNFLKVVPSSNGSFYNGYRYEERKIVISFGLIDLNEKEYNAKILKLAKILNVNSPKKLKINDSNIVYYAVPNGNVDNNKLLRCASKFDIEFICNDCLGYDEHYTGVIANNKCLSFDNLGTYSSLPVMGLTFNKTSSFVYLTNNRGETILVGTPKEEQNETIPSTVTLIDDNCSDSSTFTSGGNVTISDNRLTDGAFGVGINGTSIVATSFGTETDGKWIGTTFRKNLNKNLDQFEVKVNINFSSRGKNFVPIATNDVVRVMTQSGAYMRVNDDDTSTILKLIPYGTDLKIKTMGKNARCTVTYDGKTGWVHTKHLWRIKLNNPTREVTRNTEYAEQQLGLIEVLGLDQNGQLLFRFHIRDNNKNFEHNMPEIYLKDKLYLKGENIIPKPNTIITKDDNNQYTGEQDIPSGVFGDWNDFIGTFTIRRKKLENGKYRWWGKIARTNDGINVSQEIHMGGGVINDTLNHNPLNHLVFYIAKYSGSPAVEVMGVNHVKVNDITNEDKPPEKVNYDIFKQGDYLEINNEKCTVTLNGDNFIKNLDIGSQFFSIEEGDKIYIRSDDDTVDCKCSYRKRYL